MRQTHASNLSLKANRPVAVVLLVAVAGIGTVLSVAVGLSILWPGTFLDIIWKLNPTAYMMFTSVGKVSGVLLICLGILSLIAGLSLLQGRKWSWWLALFLLLTVAIINSSRFVAGDPGEFLGTPLTLCLLWLHLRPNVRKYFGISVHHK